MKSIAITRLSDGTQYSAEIIALREQNADLLENLKDAANLIENVLLHHADDMTDADRYGRAMQLSAIRAAIQRATA